MPQQLTLPLDVIEFIISLSVKFGFKQVHIINSKICQELPKPTKKEMKIKTTKGANTSLTIRKPLIYIDLSHLLGDNFSLSIDVSKKLVLKIIYENEKDHGTDVITLNQVEPRRYLVNLSHSPNANEMGVKFYLKSIPPLNINSLSFEKRINRQLTSFSKQDVVNLMGGFHTKDHHLFIGMCNGKLYLSKYFKLELDELEKNNVFFGQAEFFNNPSLNTFTNEIPNQLLTPFEKTKPENHAFFRLVYFCCFAIRMNIQELGIFTKNNQFYLSAKINFKQFPVFIFEEIELVKPGEFFLKKDETLQALADLGI